MTDAPSGVDQQVQGEHESHGHSVAAWTGVAIILAATIIMALAVVFPDTTWFVVGAVLVVVGVVVGRVLAMMGYGAKASTREAAHRGGDEQAQLPGRNTHDSGTQ